ncbi:oxidoreductase [Modestobacter sp. SYSU DS0657]
MPRMVEAPRPPGKGPPSFRDRHESVRARTSTLRVRAVTGRPSRNTPGILRAAAPPAAGIWADAQVEGQARVTSMIKRFGAVPAIQLGHTGRKGSEVPPHQETNAQGSWKALPPHHPDGWRTVGPSAVPAGGDHSFPVHELTVEEIEALHRSYADAARRALDAGYEWLEMHLAHGHLAASFVSPLANQRTDAYGGSNRNRARFLLEARDAVREVWPERLPLTMRLGSDDFHPAGVQFEDSIEAIGWMKEHGLTSRPQHGRQHRRHGRPALLQRARRLRLPRRSGAPRGGPPGGDQLEPRRPADRRLGDPGEQIDVTMIGRPALSNPHWPVWAARELGVAAPFDLLPPDWRWWLSNFRGPTPGIGLPPTPAEVPVAEYGEVPLPA